MPELVSATPIVTVSNVAASIEHYCRALGFTSHGVYPPDSGQGAFYAYLSRDGVDLHLERGPAGGMAVYFLVRDVDALHDELARAGAEVLYDPDAALKGPGDQPWGMREVWVKDPDGNVLRFGERIAKS